MPSSDTRERLLEVALGLFATRGYDASGVQEIVAAAGVTKPTLYHYFGSKLGLLQVLFQARAATFLSDLETAAAYDGDLTRTLDRIAAVYLAFAAAQSAFYRLHLALLFTPPAHEAHAVARALFQRQQALIEDLFRRATRDHGNMRGRHHRYAFTLISTINGYATLVLNGQLAQSSTLRRDVVHQFGHGIYS
jgi:TetR/AcrR family transcriptional regulator